MSFPVSPTPQDIPIVRQTVHFRIWGMLKTGSVDKLHRWLTSVQSSIGAKFDVDAATSPGGAQIADVPWGNMPGGLPVCLRNYGLNMAWITQPVGFEERGTRLTHISAGLNLDTRSDPARTGCDMTKAFGRLQGNPDRAARALFALSQYFGVEDATSAHKAFQVTPELFTAARAISVEELEAVLLRLQQQRAA